MYRFNKFFSKNRNFQKRQRVSPTNIFEPCSADFGHYSFFFVRRLNSFRVDPFDALCYIRNEGLPRFILGRPNFSKAPRSPLLIFLVFGAVWKCSAKNQDTSSLPSPILLKSKISRNIRRVFPRRFPAQWRIFIRQKLWYFKIVFENAKNNFQGIATLRE